MSFEDHSNKEIQFPQLCHYRIIALDLPEVSSLILDALYRLGINVELQKGNFSSHGKYVSFSTDIYVDSRKTMGAINLRLREIDAVKMVL